MRAGAHRQDRLASQREEAPNVCVEMPHLLLRPLAEPQHHYHQVGVLQEIEAGLIVPSLRIDGPVLSNGKEHGAFEAVANRENLGKLRKGLLGAVFLVPGQEHDVFAMTRTGTAFEGRPLLRPRRPSSGQAHDGEHWRSLLGMWGRSASRRQGQPGSHGRLLAGLLAPSEVLEAAPVPLREGRRADPRVECRGPPAKARPSIRRSPAVRTETPRAPSRSLGYGLA
jgi:hypothetical protein